MTRFVVKRVHVAIAAVVLAFVLAFAATAAALIWRQRQDALNNSSAQIEHFVGGAVAALNRTLLDVDVLLASLGETQELPLLHIDEIDRLATSQTLRTITQRNLMLNRLFLLDEHAAVIASSTVGDLAPLHLPPGFVQYALGVKIAALTLSTPVFDPSSAERVVYLARYLKLTDGSKVLAVAEVRLARLNTIMVQSADILGLEVTLERANGELIASTPVQDKLLGQTLPSPLGKGVARATFMPARLSAVPALVVAQAVLCDDALIAAGIPIDAALAKWQVERNFILLMTSLFSLMMLAAGGFASWYLDRLAHARQQIKRSKDEIEQLAFYDHLTNLPNRLLLLERLGHALTASKRERRCGTLLFLDLDNFKTINDTLGHDVGDMLLRQVASRLQSCVRSHDTVARLGGDEFVVLLEDLSDQPLEAAELGRRIGEKLLAALCLPYVLDGVEQKSSASIGAALFGDVGAMPAELLKQADIAMYQAKALGRNKLCFFDPQMQAAITAHAALESDLQSAIAQQQFMLYFQPQVTQAGRVLGAEVLIRWQHPTRGMVAPLEFIPVAEESDLINQIGLWVLRTACLQLKLWQLAPETAQLQLAVNVSARQFRQADFVTQVHDVIAETAIEPISLKLELTESLVLANVDDTIAKMSALKALGVRFSMDDFGTGQSSLSYLTRLPLDQLKIDQSFVRNIGIKPSDGLIVQTIIGMAGNLGLEVIAEGVETPSQHNFLAAHGCTLYQGYLFGRPAPLADFEALLTPQMAIT